MDESKNLKWESYYWYLPKKHTTKDNISTTFDDDYIIHRNNKPLVLMTSHGLSTPNEYDIWVGHTNFVLCPQTFQNIITNVPGLEAAKIVSRYRFEIVIGKLFDGDIVRSEIKNKLCLENKNEHWALIKDNHSNLLRTIHGNTQEEVIQKIQNHQVIKKSWTK